MQHTSAVYQVDMYIKMRINNYIIHNYHNLNIEKNNMHNMILGYV